MCAGPAENWDLLFCVCVCEVFLVMTVDSI